VTTKHKQAKSVEKPDRLPPIIIVPDKSYVDDTGHLIVTDTIVIVAPESHKRLLEKMKNDKQVSPAREEL